MRATGLSALLIALVLSTVFATAEDRPYDGRSGYGSGVANSVAYGGGYGRYGGGWGGRGHASTAAEGAARGTADLVRAAGENNLMNSLAARNVEEARSRYLDNRLKATDTYFEMRRVNKEQRMADRAQYRPDAEQLFRIRQQKKTKRLASDQLNPITGDISWPSLLQEDAFAEQRKELDDVFSRWASNDHLNQGDLEKVQKAIDAMDTQLSGMIRDVSANDFMAARTFLKSLQYEAKSQSG